MDDIDLKKCASLKFNFGKTQVGRSVKPLKVNDTFKCIRVINIRSSLT